MNVNEVLSLKPETRGLKRKILDIQNKGERKEKEKKSRKREAQDIPEAEYQFKRILKTKSEKDVDKPLVVKEQDVSSTVLSKKEPSSASEKEKILAALENERNEPEGEVIDLSYVKRMILSFEKKVTKNSEMRIKFPDNPEKFMESELELHDEIQKMHIIATVPEYYPIVIKLNAANTLLGLLNHENSDISIAVIDLLQEMTDVDALNESDEDAENFIETLLELQIVAVLVQCMTRLDENQKEEADGVQNALSIIENITSLKSESCSTAGEQGLVDWLLKRLKRKGFDPNKLYASEILAILLQNEEGNRQLIGELNGVDILLQALAHFKRHDPLNAEELEYMENVFNCLCSSLLHLSNKEFFLKGEGLQLMVLMLKEKKLSRTSALKVLDFAMTGPDGSDNCNKFIDILGLRSLFPLWMKAPKRNKKIGNSVEDSEEHASSIIASLFRHLVGPNRTRLVQKFVENDHIKVDRLMQIYFKYQTKVQDVDTKIEKEKDELERQGDVIDDDLEDSFYLRRLDAGLFILQVIVCIIMEASSSGVPSIKNRVTQVLNQHGGSIKDIKQIMREYASHVGDSDTDESVELEKRRLLSLVDRF
eukprot:gene18782-20673_t